MKLQDTEIEKIKNWIRTLQKSLTLETEAEFINILGKEKYFNESYKKSLKYFSFPKILIHSASDSKVKDFCRVLIQFFIFSISVSFSFNYL